MDLQKYDEAKNSINNSLNKDSNNLLALNNAGLIYADIKDFEGAKNFFKRIFQRDPHYNLAKYNYSLICLLNNNYEEGWPLFRSRWLTKAYKSQKLRSNKAELNDFKKTDSNILIYAEAGLGDEILFASLIACALQTKNNFIILLDKRLISLFQRSFVKYENVKFLSKNDLIEEASYDFHMPIGDLGIHFRKSIGDFKKTPDQFIQADAFKTKIITQSLSSKNLICGIAWKSKNEKIGKKKSLDLKDLLPIFKINHIEYINLQYGDTEYEVEDLKNNSNIEIKSINNIDLFNDIDGLASLVDACNFIVTSSNVTAHIAGALGKTTYLLVPYSSGKIWYWHENLETSLWYPKVSIYRQSSDLSWGKAITKIKNDIKKHFDL
jgi:tetratricopeptide (TPR) repeat protein